MNHEQKTDEPVLHPSEKCYMYIGVLWGLGVPATYLKRIYEDIR